MIRKNKTVLFAIASLLALCSCATIYQREGIFSNGYADSRIGQDMFVVTFRASEHTPSKKVMKYAIRRAAVVTLEHGYKYFAIVDQQDASKEHTVIHTERGYRGKRTSVSHLYYPSVRLTIKCFDAKPFGQDVFDARSYVR